MATTSESDLLHSTVLVVKAFQHYEMQLSPSQEHAARTEVAYNLLDGMNCLASFFQLRKMRLTHAHSPPPLSSSDGLTETAARKGRGITQ